MEERWDDEMMQSFLEDGYAKLPEEFNGEDGPAYADSSVDVGWTLADPVVRKECVKKFHESAVEQLGT